jgi:hypothetical protein
MKTHYLAVLFGCGVACGQLVTAEPILPPVDAGPESGVGDSDGGRDVTAEPILPPVDAGPESGVGDSDGGRDVTPGRGDGRSPASVLCGPSPELLVSSSSIPIPADVGPVQSGNTGEIAAGHFGLFYTTGFLQNNPPSADSADYAVGASLMFLAPGKAPERLASANLFDDLTLTANAVLVQGWNGSPMFASDEFTLVSAPLDGGAPTSTILNAPTASGNFASDGAFIYFSDAHGTEAMSLLADGGDAGILNLTHTSPQPGNQFGEGQGLLEVFGDQLLLSTGMGVESISLPPTTPGPLTAVSTDADFYGFVPCQIDACWVDGDGTITTMTPSGDLTRTPVPLEGSYFLVQVVSDGTSFYRLVAQNVGVVQGTTQTNWRLERIASDGGSSPFVVGTFVVGTNNTPSIAVDDDCLYWSGDQGIFSVSKAAQGPFSQ